MLSYLDGGKGLGAGSIPATSKRGCPRNAAPRVHETPSWLWRGLCLALRHPPLLVEPDSTRLFRALTDGPGRAETGRHRRPAASRAPTPLCRRALRRLGRAGRLDDVLPRAPPPLGPRLGVVPLGPEAADPVQVVGRDREAEQGHLNLSHDPEEAAGQVNEGALERSVDGLNDLPAAHRDPPRGRPEWDALPQGLLRRHDRLSTRTATSNRLGDVNHRRGPRPAHCEREPPAAQQPSTERATPTSHPVGVGPGVADQPPAGPLVELGFVLQLLELGRTP